MDDHGYIKLTLVTSLQWALGIILFGMVIGYIINHAITSPRYNNLNSYLQQEALMVTFNFTETRGEFMYFIGEEVMTLEDCIERSNLQSLGTQQNDTFQVRTSTCLKNNQY